MYKIETNISAIDSLDLVGEVRWMIVDKNNDFVDFAYFSGEAQNTFYYQNNDAPFKIGIVAGNATWSESGPVCNGSSLLRIHSEKGGLALHKPRAWAGVNGQTFRRV